MPQDQLFYVGQKAFIEKNGKLLILNDPILGPDLPGEKTQIGEFNFPSALKREINEETQLEVEIIAPFATWYYKVPERNDHRNAGKLIFMVGYECKYLSGEVRLSKARSTIVFLRSAKTVLKD